MSDAFGQASICLGSVINEISDPVLVRTSESCQGAKVPCLRRMAGRQKILLRIPHLDAQHSSRTGPPKSLGMVITWDGRLDNRAEIIHQLREGPEKSHLQWTTLAGRQMHSTNLCNRRKALTLYHTK